MTSSDDLARLKAAYRDQRVAAAFGVSAEADQLAEQLRQFCLASGHDLAELTNFFQEVDAEIAGMMPG